MKTLIIDDEASNRSLLASMLKKHCPEVIQLGDASSAIEAYEKINILKPDLIFLDVKMPEKNGFDLLRMFDKIDFSVIFVTGFDEYAVKAFEFNAIDYIIKPIDYTKLVAAVKKAELRIASRLSHVVHFVHSLEEKNNYVKKLLFHSNDKVNIIDIKDIVYIVADRGYCKIVDSMDNVHLSAKTLSDYEELLEPISHMLRVNKTHIININHIESYSKGISCIISMKKSKEEIEVSRRKKTEVLSVLKGI